MLRHISTAETIEFGFGECLCGAVAVFAGSTRCSLLRQLGAGEIIGLENGVNKSEVIVGDRKIRLLVC